MLEDVGPGYGAKFDRSGLLPDCGQVLKSAAEGEQRRARRTNPRTTEGLQEAPTRIRMDFVVH